MTADISAASTIANASASTSKSATIPSVRIEIQNGTTITGLAFRASQILDGNGYDVTKIGNAAERAYKHTVIFDLTNGGKNAELEALQTSIQAEVTMTATGGIISGNVVPLGISLSNEDIPSLATAKNIDFLVILGESASNLALK